MAVLAEDRTYFRKGSQGWVAAPPLIAAWKAAGADRGLLPSLTLSNQQRRPTGPFLGLWRASFPNASPPRAGETLCEPSGRASAELVRAWRRIP